MTAVLAEPVETVGHGRCGAKKRNGEGNCTQPAGFGTDHPGYGKCKFHGGKTASHRGAAVAQILEDKTRQLFGKNLDNQPVHNPLDVYSELAGEVRGWLGVMRQLVADLSTPGYSGLTGEQIRAEVQLYERAMDRANTVLSTYARLGIDERLARISEAQAHMVMGAIEVALAAAGVTGSRAIEAKKAAAAKLRVVDGAVVEIQSDRT